MFRQHSRQSPSHKSQKRIIFLPILERKGESSKKQLFSDARKGKVCSMKVARHAPATRFRRTQQQKSMIFEQPQRRSVLHESREPYPCHTFRNDAADFFTPSCNFEATHAQRCNSCRSGACPNVQIPYPCRLRRRHEPSKNPAIITIRPRNGLVRVVNYCPCQPKAGATATPEKKQ